MAGRIPAATSTSSARTSSWPSIRTVTPSASRSIAVTVAPVTSRTPSSASQPAIRAPASSPSRFSCGASSFVTWTTSRPSRRSEEATSQPMNPDPITATVLTVPVVSLRRLPSASVLR